MRLGQGRPPPPASAWPSPPARFPDDDPSMDGSTAMELDLRLLELLVVYWCCCCGRRSGDAAGNLVPNFCCRSPLRPADADNVHELLLPDPQVVTGSHDTTIKFWDLVAGNHLRRHQRTT